MNLGKALAYHTTDTEPLNPGSPDKVQRRFDRVPREPKTTRPAAQQASHQQLTRGSKRSIARIGNIMLYGFRICHLLERVVAETTWRYPHPEMVCCTRCRKAIRERFNALDKYPLRQSSCTCHKAPCEEPTSESIKPLRAGSVSPGPRLPLPSHFNHPQAGAFAGRRPPASMWFACHRGAMSRAPRRASPRSVLKSMWTTMKQDSRMYLMNEFQSPAGRKARGS